MCAHAREHDEKSARKLAAHSLLLQRMSEARSFGGSISSPSSENASCCSCRPLHNPFNILDGDEDNSGGSGGGGGGGGCERLLFRLRYVQARAQTYVARFEVRRRAVDNGRPWPRGRA